jgi:hypothetical protein
VRSAQPGFILLSLQSAWPAAQVHSPAAQIWLLTQAVAQSPQCAGVLLRSAQPGCFALALQSVWPTAQVQAPSAQIWLLMQAVLQSPQ